jgi:hypothetical protein
VSELPSCDRLPPHLPLRDMGGWADGRWGCRLGTYPKAHCHSNAPPDWAESLSLSPESAHLVASATTHPCVRYQWGGALPAAVVRFGDGRIAESPPIQGPCRAVSGRPGLQVNNSHLQPLTRARSGKGPRRGMGGRNRKRPRLTGGALSGPFHAPHYGTSRILLYSISLASHSDKTVLRSRKTRLSPSRVLTSSHQSRPLA